LSEAEELLVQALKTAQQLYGADALDTAPNLNALGQLRALQGRLPEARALLTQCLAIRERELPPEDERIGSVIARLAALPAD
jgi:hypothetical protein